MDGFLAMTHNTWLKTEATHKTPRSLPITVTTRTTIAMAPSMKVVLFVKQETPAPAIPVPSEQRAKVHVKAANNTVSMVSGKTTASTRCFPKQNCAMTQKIPIVTDNSTTIVLNANQETADPATLDQQKPKGSELVLQVLNSAATKKSSRELVYTNKSQ